MFAKRVGLTSFGAMVLGATLWASGSGSGGSATGGGGGGATGGGGSTATATELTLRIPNEMAPPGGLVQMKILTTEVTPISGGRPGFGFDGGMAAAGFGMFATGDLAGAAVIDANHVTVSYKTNGALTANYPLLAVALWIGPGLSAGSKTLFTADPGAIWNTSTAGPIFAKPITPATITVGGTVSITDVVPGEGVWPAGTIVSVRGIGFGGKTQIRVNDVANKGIRIVSPTELQFSLAQATEMRGVKITVQNPENTDTYYAYMRGLVSTVSSRTLLAATEPIFALTPRTVATLGPIGSLAGNQYQAVALQNPTMDDVTVTIALNAADGTPIVRTSRTLEGLHRVALEASELLDGVAPPAGSSLVVSASAPIDVISLLCDEGTWIVVPSLPLESPR